MPSKTIKKSSAKLAQNPLILRSHRLMEVFAKSDDERDFLLDRQEGFLIFIDLDKPEPDLEALWEEISKNPNRYVMIPKLSFYETKKIMEGFVNEKVYDIDTKEKLIEIISSREARENFLEFIYDHHGEMEKWQQYYVERSRIRIIEWLRQNNFEFVFEEDLELPKEVIEKIKLNLFESKGGRDVEQGRKLLHQKAKTYYSNEALNPRPKRGRPPKQVLKAEIEREVSNDIYTTVPATIRPFLFTPDVASSQSATFSTRFETENELLDRKRKGPEDDYQATVDSLNQKLMELRSISSKWVKEEPIEEVDEEAPVKNKVQKENIQKENVQKKSESSLINKKSVSKTPTAKTPARKTPVVKAPVIASVTKTPLSKPSLAKAQTVKVPASKSPAKVQMSKTPVKVSAPKTPIKMSTSKAPVKVPVPKKPAAKIMLTKAKETKTSASKAPIKKKL